MTCGAAIIPNDKTGTDMSIYTPNELASAIGNGLLSFPVTHFDSSYAFAEDRFRAHVGWLAAYKPAGLFAGGGTGEFFSLTPGEIIKVVSAAVSEVDGKVPVLAGCGYSVGTAVEMAKAAEAAGADGLLLLPPYLVSADQAGLAAYVRAVCDATSLAVIVYNRDNGILLAETLAGVCKQCPNLVGFKDGVGDLELMVRIYATLGDRLTYIGGLPTAETFALPYLEMGVTTYSSAIFNFLPEFALDFYDAVRRRDQAAVYKGLREVVLPYTALRDRKKGYAVSIVKAGLKLMGRDAGPVRPPLVDLDRSEMEQLAALLEATGHLPARIRSAAAV